MNYDKEWSYDRIFGTLTGINNGVPIIVKDAEVYESSNWVPYTQCQTKYPIQRKLLPTECVMDFDKVTDIQVTLITNYLKSTGIKFNAWKSSNTGMHVHFFCNVTNKYEKIELVHIVSSRVEELFGVKNDINPMRQEFIRCEYSYHPKKGTQKLPLYLGINPLFYVNSFPHEIMSIVAKNVPKLDENGRPIIKNLPKSLENPPKCVRYILSNRFTDGRKRLLFALAGWYKNLIPDEEILKLLKEWAQKQDMNISDYKIRATIRSTNGTVGCRYRHLLLEELGHETGCENKKIYK